MSDIIKVIPKEKMKDVSVALGQAIQKYPKQSLAAVAVLGGLYILKDKKIKFKFKSKNHDIQFETE